MKKIRFYMLFEHNDKCYLVDKNGVVFEDIGDDIVFHTTLYNKRKWTVSSVENGTCTQWYFHSIDEAVKYVKSRVGIIRKAVESRRNDSTLLYKYSHADKVSEEEYKRIKQENTN